MHVQNKRNIIIIQINNNNNKRIKIINLIIIF